MRRLLPTSILSLTLCALLLSAACIRTGPTGPPPQTPTTPGAGVAPDVLSQQDRAEIFRQVWETVNEHYYDPTFRGLDWRAVGERYRPRAESARGDAEFYGVFELMLAELRDGHTIFIPPRMPGAKKEDEARAPGESASSSARSKAASRWSRSCRARRPNAQACVRGSCSAR